MQITFRCFLRIKMIYSFFVRKIIPRIKTNLFPRHSVWYRYKNSTAKTFLAEKMSGNSDKHERIVWVDLEMTGLDLKKDRIIEMACIVTDENLNVIAKSPNLIINQPDSLLDSMNDWCKKHHGQSGLTDAVKKSDITQLEAEKMILAFVEQHTPKSACPLAGNSIHTDKMFLEKFMPDFMKHLHYRIIDVSSIKELCRRWYPHVYRKAPPKALTHRAEDDIQESIEELKYYRKAIFIQE